MKEYVVNVLIILLLFHVTCVNATALSPNSGTAVSSGVIIFLIVIGVLIVVSFGICICICNVRTYRDWFIGRLRYYGIIVLEENDPFDDVWDFDSDSDSDVVENSPLGVYSDIEVIEVIIDRSSENVNSASNHDDRNGIVVQTDDWSSVPL